MKSALSASPHWHEVTALFGGTFDPPHLGHREAVDGLFAPPGPGVRDVRVIPSPLPPHKSAGVAIEHRIEMARLAFAPTSAGTSPLRGPVTLDLCEIERAKAHPGHATYSFDTISELGRDFPRLAFVIGTDQLEKLPSWSRFPRLLGLCHWIVLKRKEASTGLRQLTELEASGLILREGPGYRVRQGGTFIQVFETPARPLSSSQIREQIARTGQPPEGSILPEVGAYLMKHRLYGTSGGTNPA
jgi:nicotinate-nucleotide adenylyltransferase